MSQNSPWKGGMERRFTCGSPLFPVSHRSKFTPCEVNSPVLPCCITWQSLGKPDPTPIGFIWAGEQWEEAKSLGLSLHKQDHLGPHRDDCHSNTSGRESRRRVRLRESEEEDKKVWCTIAFIFRWLKSRGNRNYVSILRTLAFLSWFLRKLMLEAIASNITSGTDTTPCLPQIPSTNDWFISKGHRPPYRPSYILPLQNRQPETVSVMTFGYSWRDSESLCHSVETGSQERRRELQKLPWRIMWKSTARTIQLRNTLPFFFL